MIVPFWVIFADPVQVLKQFPFVYGWLLNIVFWCFGHGKFVPIR